MTPKEKRNWSDYPRDEHYYFAHYTIREMCSEDPARFYDMMSSREGKGFLAQIWQSNMMEHNATSTDADRSTPCVFKGQVKNFSGIFIEMPEPVGRTEAFFIGILFDAGKSIADSRSGQSFRYFTLEYAGVHRGTLKTKLCEWTEDGHMNYGDGPTPSLSHFLKEIELLV